MNQNLVREIKPAIQELPVWKTNKKQSCLSGVLWVHENELQNLWDPLLPLESEILGE